MARPLFLSSSIRILSFSSCLSFGTYVRSLGVSGFATALADAFTNDEEVREWSGESEPEMVESLVGESKNPLPERGDHSSDGTGM